MMRCLKIMVLAWLASSLVYAQPTPDVLTEVSRRLDTSGVLRGEFEQTKTLKGFKRPLVSRGSFVMARGRGVQWVTTQPFASTLVITRDQVLALSASGVPQPLGTRQGPGVHAVNDMLIALLAGDIKALAVRFQADGVLHASQGWQLTLLPRDAALAGFMSRIELEGDRYVTGVVFHEASGDDSRIRFFNQAASALTSVEAARLSP